MKKELSPDRLCLISWSRQNRIYLNGKNIIPKSFDTNRTSPSLCSDRPIAARCLVIRLKT